MLEKIRTLKGKASHTVVMVCVILAPLSIFLMSQYVYTGYLSLYSFGITIINYIAISVIMWSIIALSNKYTFGIVFSHIAMYIWVMVNYFVSYYRGNPVLPWDITALGTAGDVMLAYKYYPTLQMIIAGIYIIVISCIVFYTFPKREFGFKKENIPSRAISLVIVFLCVIIISSPKRIESYGAKTDVWDQAKAYKEGGTLAVFLANLRWLDVEVPEGYSEDMVDGIMSDVDTEAHEDVTRPNIIAIMNESWSDLEAYDGLEFSEDLMSEIKSIEGIHFGHAYASVFGAGTSASEFEFLTGNSMAFLPSGSIPYQQYTLTDTTSIASVLKDQGYSTHAFHPGDASSWNRNVAYPLLGFDTFKSRDDMTVDIIEAHGGYVSDASDFKELIADYEARDKTKPYFYFNVTIQSHGGYQDTTYPTKVEVVGYEGEFPMAEQYLTLVKETDIAFAELIDYFKGVKEPVIIVMFGDHKPALEEEFYELLYDHGDEVSMEEYLERFEVPYVFWTNMETDIDTDITSLNFLGQKLLEYAGVKTSTYADYLLDLSDTLPAISFAGYFDSDGEAYSHLETNDLTDLIDRYQIVQYSNLFGQHKEEWFDLLH